MRSRGFTLIEVVITLAIVGLMATAVFPLAELSVQRNKEAQLADNLRKIRTALDAYKQAADNGQIEMEVGQSGYPPDLATLVSGVTDVSDPNLPTIYFLRRLPRDPFYPDPTADPADTWGLRSYESPPDDPQAGDDVFDVFSQSERIGLNGVPYRDW
jgi:general secretion pathway protein G